MRYGPELLCAILLALPGWIVPEAAKGQAVKVAEKGGAPGFAAIGNLTLNTSPSYIRFKLVRNRAAFGDNPIQITTTYYNLGGVRTNIDLYGYFASAHAALSGSVSAASIPSGAVLGKMTTGLPREFVAFTQASPIGGGGASLRLFSWPVHRATTGLNLRVDSLNLEIDLTGLSNLSPDTYTGTLILQAQAF